MHPKAANGRSRAKYNDVSKWLINRGGMCERLKQAVLKTAVRETVPGVRIPLPPPCVLQCRVFVIFPMMLRSMRKSLQRPAIDVLARPTPRATYELLIYLFVVSAG